MNNQEYSADSTMKDVLDDHGFVISDERKYTKLVSIDKAKHICFPATYLVVKLSADRKSAEFRRVGAGVGQPNFGPIKTVNSPNELDAILKG